MTLQDIFPAIFAYIFEDLAILDAKIPPVTDQGKVAFFLTSLKKMGLPLRVAEPLPYGVRIVNGIIEGGIDDGKPLFESMPRTSVPSWWLQ